MTDQKPTRQINPWELLTINLQRAEQMRCDVAVLPTGAVEAHNMHLPEGQDVLHTDIVTARACAYAWEKEAAVLKLPIMPFGVDCNLLKFPYTLHISQRVLDAVIEDIAASLHGHGIQKLVIVNGHGGNDFIPLVRQLQHEQDIFAFVCDWWKVGHDRYFEIFENPDDHAGEMETSIALALYPEWVELENAKDGCARPSRFEAVKQRWVKTSRDFSKLNDHCATGDPSKATAEKGNQYLRLVTQRLGDFLVDLAKSPIDDTFPFA